VLPAAETLTVMVPAEAGVTWMSNPAVASRAWLLSCPGYTWYAAEAYWVDESSGPSFWFEALEGAGPAGVVEVVVELLDKGVEAA
jgi:hypothetical protein